MSDSEAEKPFFQRATVKGAIKALAAADNLSIFAGSGVASDAGLPPWDSLLNELLRDLPGARGDGTEDWGSFVAEAQDAESTLGRASLVESNYADDEVGFGERLAAALRFTDPDRPARALVEEVDGPGHTAKAIASLCVDVEPQKQPRFIVTTNFDLLLEFALMRAVERPRADGAAIKPDVKPVTGTHTPASAQADGRWRVHHLHGWLPVPVAAAKAIGVPADVEGALSIDGNRLVLSETGYYGTHRGPDWQDDVVEGTLEEGATLLIVGTSLADPALVRHIYRTHSLNPNRGVRAYAVLLRPVALHTLAEDKAKARIAYEQAAEARWGAVGVNVVFADFRFQVAQFCSEVALGRSSTFSSGKARAQFSSTARYGARLDSWFTSAYQRGALISADTDGDGGDLEQASEAFQDAQRTLTQRLRELISGPLLDLFEEELGQDHLALHLWCRMPRRLVYGRASDLIAAGGICALGMIGASDRSWADPESVDTRELAYDADRIAVRAFTTQAVGLASAPMSTWDQLVAVPVSLVDQAVPARRLPVGVLSLNARAANEGEPAGLTLLRDHPKRMAELTQVLTKYGQKLLKGD